MASFYGIGVDPGDSELLTIKAINTIKNSDVLYVLQAHRGSKSVTERIAAPYLPTTLAVRKRHLPAVKDQDTKMEGWRGVADEIRDDVQQGNDVGFLTLGSPSVYSTFNYLAGILVPIIDIQTIAGISSFNQIATSLSIPLMLDEESLEVVPATADKRKSAKVIDLSDNAVIMEVITNSKKVYQILKERKLLDKTAIIENTSMANRGMQRLTEYSTDNQLPCSSTTLLEKEEA